MQQPTLGRTVLFRLPDGAPDINGARIFPAVIVRVWNETMVNLRVLTDGYENMWQTSVTLYSSDPSTGRSCWWPPRS